MEALIPGHRAIFISVAIALLAGCGVSQPPIAAPGANTRSAQLALAGSGGPDVLPHQHTFYYTGAKQSFKVPAGVTELTVVALGAHGAGKPEAFGGRVYAVIPVTPGETLLVFVGGNGFGKRGGFNGGGSSSSLGSGDRGFGGGGASDVRQGGASLGDRIIVSGGAGGAGKAVNHRGDPGGKGGGTIGGTGGCGLGSGRSGYCSSYGGSGGDGGTQSAGGQGGAGGQCFIGSGSQGANGALGVGGNGGAAGYGPVVPGGGGGGGYYGGGGGGSGCAYDYYYGGGGGGGGGSSYAERTATNVRFWQGWKLSAHNGLVVFSW